MIGNEVAESILVKEGGKKLKIDAKDDVGKTTMSK